MGVPLPQAVVPRIWRAVGTGCASRRRLDFSGSDPVLLFLLLSFLGGHEEMNLPVSAPFFMRRRESRNASQ
jgi:hypothetical protein